jgi:fatty acid amide hydrolase
MDSIIPTTISRNQKILISASGSLLLYSLIKYLRRRAKAKKMRDKGKAKLNSKLSQPIPVLPKVSEEKTAEILSLKVHELVEGLNNKTLTSMEVLSVYISRCIDQGRRLNLSAEELFHDAITRIFSIPASGLLLGVPISIKDEIFQENCSSSGGVVWLSESKDPNDSILVSLLRKQGALPFVRGNAMQLMMWFETTNNLYGTAQNPWDTKRTPGGSSGGDAGLVASRCCPIAIGSDIAGSIRIPSAFCGVYGFKPSSRRITSMDCVATHPKGSCPLEFVVKASYGPIGRCVEDLSLVLRSWWRSELWENDDAVIPLSFNEEEYKKEGKLRIGYFEYNQVFECAQVVKNVVQETVQKLQELGHEMVPVNTNMIPRAAELFIRATYAIPGSYMMEELQGEDPAWTYMKSYYQAKSSIFDSLFRMKCFLTGHWRLAYYLKFAKQSTFSELCEISRGISEFKFEFGQYWNELGLDAIVCPIWPLVAPLHRTTVKIAPAFSYSFLWNLLDYPAGVVPVRQVQEGEDIYDSKERDSFVKVAKEIMSGSVGLPVSIQVIGKPYEDEKTLRLMKVVEKIHQFHKLADI